MPGCYDCGDYWECDGEGGECQNVRVMALKKRSGCTGEIEDDIVLEKPNEKVKVAVKAWVELEYGSNHDRWDFVPRVTLNEIEAKGRGNGGKSEPHGRKWQINTVIDVPTDIGKVKFRVQAYVYPYVADPSASDKWLLSPKVWIEQLG